MPMNVPSEWLHIDDPTYGISWKVPRNWYWIPEEHWPTPMPGSVLLRTTASEEDAALLLSSPQPIFPNGLMVLTVHAVLAEAAPQNLQGAQPVTVSGQRGWVQEIKGVGAAPFSWRARLFVQGTSAYSYTLSFDCAPPSGADAAGQAGFEASCRYIWEQILEGIEIMEKKPCLPAPMSTPGPITWRRVSDDWYKYSFEVPSGWYEDQSVTPDRRVFFSAPAVAEQSPYCPSSDGLMKLDFGVDPLEKYQPDLSGMTPITVAGRPAWVFSGEGGEAGPSTFLSVYISGPQYWYSLWLGCTPRGANAERYTFVAECTSVMNHILESFQILP